MRVKRARPALVILSALLMLFAAEACAPGHAPVPPGVVPKAKPLSVTDEQYGHQVFQELADRYEQDYNNPRAVEVQNIVDRLSQAAGAGNDPWHVYIFKDASVKNAAATRGNHVFIWSGILDSTKNEAELATILAHEMSHVLAGHTDPDPNEETEKLLIAIGAMAAGIAVSAAIHSPGWGQNVGDLTSQVTNEVGSSLLVYPYSRDKEYEADQIGLFLMADAKYDPQSAVDFWRRAETDPELSGRLGFLSTHPPAQDRLARLEALLPQATARYNGTHAPNAVAQQLPPPNVPDVSTTGQHRKPRAQPPLSSSPKASPDPSSAPPSGTDDSFAFGRADAPGGSVIQVPSEAHSLWVSKAQKSFVYQEARPASKKLGELSRGASVEVVASRGPWLEIVRPEPGYVVRKDFEPR